MEWSGVTRRAELSLFALIILYLLPLKEIFYSGNRDSLLYTTFSHKRWDSRISFFLSPLPSSATPSLLPTPPLLASSLRWDLGRPQARLSSCGSAAAELGRPRADLRRRNSAGLMRICNGGARRICGSPPPDSRTSRAALATSRARSCGGPCKQGWAALPLLWRAGVLPPPALPFRAGPPPPPSFSALLLPFDDGSRRTSLLLAPPSRPALGGWDSCGRAGSAPQRRVADVCSLR